MNSHAPSRLTHRLWAWFATLILALFVSHPALAQSSQGALQGFVYDQDGLPIPGVTVTLSSTVLIGGTQEEISSDAGYFRFLNLPPGSYTLRGTFGGGTQSITDIQVVGGQTVSQDLILGQEMETITVSNASTVDTTSTSIGTTLTSEMLSKLPVGRSYQQALQLSAGVTGGGSNPNIGGGSYNENNYQIDGVNVTDPVTGTFGANFNFDAIQQIETVLGGYDAENGFSLGGMVNISTQSGSNNLEYSTSVYYLNGQWRPKKDSRFTADGYTLGPSGFDNAYQTIQINSQVSGPLVQDKAFFLLSYSYNRSLIANSGVPQQRDFDGHYILAKITAQPTTAHRITLLFQSDPTSVDNTKQDNPFTKAEAQSRQWQGGFVGSARWQWFISPIMNLDTQVSVQKISLENYSVPCTHRAKSDSKKCAPGEQDGTIDYYTPGRSGAFGAFDSQNSGVFIFDDRWRIQAQSALSFVAIKDPLGGLHDIKFGVQMQQLLNNRLFGYNANVMYVDINAAGYDPQTFQNYYWQEASGPQRERNTGSIWSAFIQDAYKPISNLTIRYGLRMDHTVLRNDIGDPSIRATMFAPRLFAAWDPFGDQKTKIAGGYGRFNEAGRQAVAGYNSVSSFGAKLFLGEYFNSAGAGFGRLSDQTLMYDYGPKENPNQIYNHLRMPSVDELDLTIQRQIIPDLSFATTFQGRFFRNLYEPDETSLIYDQDGSEVIGSRRANSTTSYPRLRTPRMARRNYYRLDFTLAKRTSRRWGGQLTYSYTFINGSSSTGGSGDSMSGSFLNDPQSRYNYGPISNATTHGVRFFAFWDVAGTDPNTTSLGASLIYNSGTPLERAYWDDYGQGYGLRVRPAYYYWRFNGQWEAGIRLQQSINVRKGTLMVDLQLNNVFNNQAPMVLSGSFYTTNRLFTVQRQDPLRIQLGLAYKF